MARYIFYATLLIGSAIYALTLYQSRQRIDSNLFRDAELLILDQKWNQARTALIEVLREDPLHPGAHFYLGRAYIFADDARPVMAEGEFLTALALFRNQNRVSFIDRFPPAYFEMMCYVEAAKANLLMLDSSMRANADLPAIQSIVSTCAYYADCARAIQPNAEEVRDLDAILEGLPPQFTNSVRPQRDEPFTSTPRMTV